MTSPYNDAEYRRNKTSVLAGNPDCALCGQPGADSVDHIVALMNGGDHSLTNLQPAHAKCNSIKGARQQAQRQAATRQRREQGIKQSEAFFTETQSTDRKSVV